MPILPQETDIFPHDLLTREEPENSSSLQWWVAYTHSRREKEFVRNLHSQEISFYCPIVPHQTRSPEGRNRTSFIPLFPNYVFLYTGGDGRLAALKTNLVVRLLKVENRNQLRNDLKQLQRLIHQGIPLTREVQMDIGDRVRVKNGPLKGIVGTVIQRNGREELLISVNFLQQGASIRIDRFDLELVS